MKLSRKFVRSNKGRLILTVETDATATREFLELYKDIFTIIIPAVISGDLSDLENITFLKEDK